MKPAAKRRVEREIQKIMRTDGDNCSLCRLPLAHNSRTFGGITKDGTPALVGECCAKKLHETILMGMFASRDWDVLPVTKRSDRAPAAPDVEEAIASIQSVFADRAAESETVARNAGLGFSPTKVFRAQTSWKEDDAQWFSDHPHRSHRLRPLVGDEAKVCGFDALGPMPPKHDVQILVRQVEPGARVRTPFGRNLDLPIPDEETVLHALFDLVQQGGGGTVISTTDLLGTIGRYSHRDRGPAN